MSRYGDGWIFRVKLSEVQAIVGFEKMGTVGIGFAVEEDWNTNLPYSVPAAEIFKHIAHNKADDAIEVAEAIAAIQMVREAAARYKKTDLAEMEQRHA